VRARAQLEEHQASESSPKSSKHLKPHPLNSAGDTRLVCCGIFQLQHQFQLNLYHCNGSLIVFLLFRLTRHLSFWHYHRRHLQQTHLPLAFTFMHQPIKVHAINTQILHLLPSPPLPPLRALCLPHHPPPLPPTAARSTHAELVHLHLAVAFVIFTSSPFTRLAGANPAGVV
jgi:hypothetical protein